MYKGAFKNISDKLINYLFAQFNQIFELGYFLDKKSEGFLIDILIRYFYCHFRWRCQVNYRYVYYYNSLFIDSLSQVPENVTAKVTN